MFAQISWLDNNYGTIMSALIFFGALYYFLWKSGENMRVRGIVESARVRRLRFVISCLITAVWLISLISPVSQIDIFESPWNIVILFLIVVIPVTLVFMDLVKQYNERLYESNITENNTSLYLAIIDVTY